MERGEAEASWATGGGNVRHVRGVLEVRFYGNGVAGVEQRVVKIWCSGHIPSEGTMKVCGGGAS